MKVGISEVDITPPVGMRLAGMLTPTRAEGVQWPLMGRTVVFDDGVQKGQYPSVSGQVPQAVIEGGVRDGEEMVVVRHVRRSCRNRCLGCIKRAGRSRRGIFHFRK